MTDLARRFELLGLQYAEAAAANNFDERGMDRAAKCFLIARGVRESRKTEAR